MRSLAWITDVHLNFVSSDSPEYRALCKELRRSRAEAVLLGDDTAEAANLEHWLSRLSVDIECPICFVLGNHDYYGSSVAEVRASATSISRRHASINWLGGPSKGVIALNDQVALVGVGGWGDARLGNVESSPVCLADFDEIAELRAEQEVSGRLGIHEELRRLGKDDALRLERALQRARSFSRVIVLTHVPPFRAACWYEGQLSGEDWLPYFVCDSVGQVLSRHAADHPEQRILVLCGHTHGAGEAIVAPNLRVITGGAKYGHPAVQRLLDLDGGISGAIRLSR